MLPCCCIEMIHDHVLKKLNFDLMTPSLEGEGGTSAGKIFATMLQLHSWFSLIWNASWPCSEKVEFWHFVWPQPQVQVCVYGGGGGGGGGVCGQNICYHVAESLILLNLICNLTMFWKSWILTYWPHHQGQGLGGGGSAGKIFATMLLHSWFSLIWYTTPPCSEKVEFWPQP